MVAQAQCAGFLCGPKEELIADTIISAQDGVDDMINFIFLIMQVLVGIVIAIPLIVAAVSSTPRDEYGKPVAGSMIILFIVFVVNGIAGWAIGTGIAGGPNGGDDAALPLNVFGA